MKRLRAILADGVRPDEDAVLVLLPTEAAAAAAGPVIDALCDGHHRLSVVIIPGPTVSNLTERFSSALIRRPPLVFSLTIASTLAALRVRSVLAIDPMSLQTGSLGPLLNGAIGRGVPVYGLNHQALEGNVIDDAELRPLSDLAPAIAGPLTTTQIARVLSQAIGIERLPRWSLDKLAGRVAGSPLRRALAVVLRKLDTADKLRQHLRVPKTILCLGNGPSSMNPILAQQPYDALFRVNHDWRSAGYLAQPDLVFAGVKRSMRKFRGTVIGVATERKEHALIACRAFEPWHGHAPYFVVDEIARDILPDSRVEVRPTTGAYMIGASVALAPDRLIVAGMDMFRHPDGAYAGGSDINAYTPAHGRDADAEFICGCLRHFRGELVSYSKAFSDLARSLGPDAPFFFRDESQG